MSEENTYANFVDTLLSEPSSDIASFETRISDLSDQGCQIERLLTGAVGASAEAGELMEIVKKIIFQGKPFDEHNVFHMKRELGDLMFYIQTTCLALGFTIDEVIDENIKKLESRYPGGKFNIDNSENRKENDL